MLVLLLVAVTGFLDAWHQAVQSLLGGEGFFGGSWVVCSLWQVSVVAVAWAFRTWSRFLKYWCPVVRLSRSLLSCDVATMEVVFEGMS